MRYQNLICTIISRRDLAKAACLLHSLKSIHPDVGVAVLCVDANLKDSALLEDSIILTGTDLGVEHWEHFTTKYDMMELCTAVKPFLLQYLFKNFNTQKIIYLDSDIVVYRRLDLVFDLLEKYSCVLTPHILRPSEAESAIREVDFLRVGCFNLGFFAIARNNDWQPLLEWWKGHLYIECVRQQECGIFLDQKWADLFPCLFQNVYILRDPSFNVSWWNYHERYSDHSAQSIDETCTFFHFSGYNPQLPDEVTRFLPNLHLSQLPAAVRSLYQAYQQQLLANGYAQSARLQSPYGVFADDVPISGIARLCLRNFGGIL